MRRVLIIGSLFAVAVLVSISLNAPSEPASTSGSPAFQSLLGQAIARMNAVPERVAEVSVSATHAGPRAATVDEYTCSGFHTCDAMATCDGNPTCDGEITCWCSTCMSAPTCEETCELYTRDQSETCSGSPTCAEGCPGWPTYHGLTPTCVGGPTCELTCTGFITCSGCVAIERTTWGFIKAEFAD